MKQLNRRDFLKAAGAVAGAAWSVISPLSAQSVANRSESITIPDFTRGAWRSATPLGIVGS